MQHEDTCESWASFHPFDCPECKILLRAGTDLYTQDEYDRAVREAYQDGFDEAELQYEELNNESYKQALEEAVNAVRSLM